MPTDNLARRTAFSTSITQGNERNADEPPSATHVAPEQHNDAPQAQNERPNRTQPNQRTEPPIHRPQNELPKEITASEFSSELNKLNLLERFEPEARDLNPNLVAPGFNGQNLYNQVYEYYFQRFNDIAYASDSTVAYMVQVGPSAERVANLTLNAVTNKLIIANRFDGLNVANIANPVGPPKGHMFPALVAAVIAAIGKTSPIWSGDTYFTPDLGNAVPVVVDSDNNQINNIHQFAPAFGADQIIQRFCAAGGIPMRAVDWKVPGGSPHWLAIRNNQNGRTTMSTADTIHPDNFDPPNTVLASICACTSYDHNLAKYIIMKSVATPTVLSLVSKAYEQPESG